MIEGAIPENAATFSGLQKNFIGVAFENWPAGMEN
jgi:hypothetical protein